MKFLSVLSFLFFLCAGTFAQDVTATTREADRLEAIPDEKAALQKFKEVLKVQPANLYALTKCSELCSRIGGREKENKKLRDDYFNTSIIYARTALRLYPDDDASNVTMAIAVGRTVLLKSGKEKINAVKELKTYADKALLKNPNNFKAWHILGKWNFEVSNLNGIERGAVKMIYGGLPTASLKTAISCYEKAKAINPSFALNYLELAKAYKRNDQKQKGIDQLKYLLTLKNQTEDDPRIKAEATTLIKDWE